MGMRLIANQVEAIACSTSGLGMLVKEALAVIEQAVDTHGYVATATHLVRDPFRYRVIEDRNMFLSASMEARIVRFGQHIVPRGAESAVTRYCGVAPFCSSTGSTMQSITHAISTHSCALHSRSIPVP